MEIKAGKQIVYRYDGDASSDEVEDDLDGDIAMPERDHIITRNGKQWKVVHVITEKSLTNPPTTPIVRVFLTGHRRYDHDPDRKGRPSDVHEQ